MSVTVPDDVVTLEQDDGVWWFIGPDSERFVSLEVNHIPTDTVSV